MRTHNYDPPDVDDYSNVNELNQAWLKATTDLRGPQRARLANAPFLLFSLREHDLEWWRDALAEAPQGDWVQRTGTASESLRRVQSAALGFIWQLALRNPYAARLVSGAGVTWCETLTATPLITLIDRVADRDDLTTPRLERTSDAFFHADCTSVQSEVRRSSHLSALQSLLTTPVVNLDQPLRAAACHMPRPRLKVADRRKE